MFGITEHEITCSHMPEDPEHCIHNSEHSVVLTPISSVVNVDGDYYE